MIRPTAWCCVVAVMGCLWTTEVIAEAKSRPKREAAKKSAKKRRPAARRRAATRPTTPPRGTSWKKLRDEQQDLEMKIQSVERRLRADAELSANRKVLTSVIRKKAKRVDADYDKLRSELATLRERTRKLQLQVTKIEEQVAQDPAVARLQQEVDALAVKKGNKINPDYGKWVARREELRSKIRQMRRKRPGKKTTATRPRKAK